MEQYQKELDKFYKEKGWPYWQPLSILARLTEEVGELARLVNHLYGDKKKKLEEPEQNLEDEMGDVIYTLICLANSNNLSLDRAIRHSFDKVLERDKNRWNRE
jgi:NTP pyrophosphatase (non-canonical NTP hydrolase)